MLRRLSCATGIALILAGTGMVHAEDGHDDVTLYRVFVADHAEPRITAFDLTEPANRWSFQTTGQSRLYPIDNGTAIAAVQSDADTVHFLRSGVTLSAHGDHSDIEIADPASLPQTLSGPRPFHLIDHGGKVVINFDGGGYAGILDAHALSDGTLEERRLPQARAHHGYVAPIGNGWVTSVASDAPVEGDAAPSRIGLQPVDGDGKPTGEVAACTAIHGEAFSGAYLATGCKEGILPVTAGENGPAFKMLDYPADLPSGQSTGTLLGSTAMQVFLGNYGAKGLVVIDPVDTPHLRYVELPFRRIDFTLDPANARFAYVLTEDGTLHQFDMLEAKVTASARVTEPYSMDGHWSDPRPRLAMAGDEVVMSDPKAGLIRRIAKADLKEIGTIAVDGMPFNIAVVGGSGVVHDHADHDHAGHDHAGHAHSHGDPQIYKGYFEDAQVVDRPLSDYAGDWQSVYPYLQDGTLDPVWAHKAEGGTMSADAYRAEYETGYRTDVERITIEGDTVTFYRDGKPIGGTYVYDGLEILTYKKGNRGVRFIFQKTAGDDDAPQFIQFSDHKIAPEKTDHFHLYWGNDRAALLEEVTNWPTYYPSRLDADQIVEEMLAH